MAGEVGGENVELERMRLRYSLYLRVLPIVGIVAYILAATIPLLVVNSIIDKLAGETTVVDISVILQWTVYFSVALNIAQAAKAHVRKRELKRTRARKNALESQLGHPTGHRALPRG